jgi:hypothetical protein
MWFLPAQQDGTWQHAQLAIIKQSEKISHTGRLPHIRTNSKIPLIEIFWSKKHFPLCAKRENFTRRQEKI